jgi:hypothetical protein
LVKDYLRTKLASFEHEVFAALFLDSQHRLIEYVELFRGTIDQASVYPREVVKEALRLNAAAVIFSHNHPSGNPEPSQADKLLTSAPQGGPGAGGRAHAGSHRRRRRGHHVIRRAWPALTHGGFGPLFAASDGAAPALAGLRVLRTCRRQAWVGGGVGRSCCSLHRITAFSPSRAARALRACVLAAVADP